MLGVELKNFPALRARQGASGSSRVAQVSKPAVSPISNRRDVRQADDVGRFQRLRIWKSATQPTWKSALQVMPFGNSKGESQRDSGTQPRVARNELPWETAAAAHNPNGVAAHPGQPATTPLGLKTDRTVTQGSSFLATLGWRAQSRWDCEMQIALPCIDIVRGREFPKGICATGNFQEAHSAAGRSLLVVTAGNASFIFRRCNKRL